MSWFSPWPRNRAADFQALQDRVRLLEAQLEYERDSRRRAEAEARESTRKLTDFLAQQMFGRPIYGEAPTLPEKPFVNPEPITPRRRQARDIVREAEEEFERQLKNANRSAKPAPESTS